MIPFTKLIIPYLSLIYKLLSRVLFLFFHFSPSHLSASIASVNTPPNRFSLSPRTTAVFSPIYFLFSCIPFLIFGKVGIFSSLYLVYPVVSLTLICSFSRMRSHLDLGDVKPEDVSKEIMKDVLPTEALM